MKKPLFSLGLAAVMGAALIAPLSVTANADTEKKVDVWIVAGQSNAAGYSQLNQTVYGGSGNYKQYLTGEDSRNAQGYNGVLYYGATEVQATSDLPEIALQSVKMGQGAWADRIGPELGMANVLASRYTSESPAAIIKFAVGGTYLGDFKGDGQQSKDFGTWASPSMTEAYSGTPCTYNGLLYTRLLSVVQSGFAALKAEGYIPSVKGYIWMQGEADAATGALANAYASNLELFINDLRQDVAETAEDQNAKNRPFVIGKINSTGWFGGAGEIATVRAAEDSVAQKVANVYTVDTDRYTIRDMSKPSGGEAWTTVGSDNWHFNAKDMYDLGKRFAQAALDGIAGYTYIVRAGAGGSAAQSVYLSDGEEIMIGYTADRGKILDKVELNGADVTESAVKDGVIKITPQNGDASVNEILLSFKNAQSYRLSVSVSGGGRVVSRTPSSSVIYAGDELTLVLSANAGYEVDSVKLNGEVLAPRADGKYVAALGGKDYTVEIAFKQTEAGNTNPDPEEEKESGCASSVSVSVAAAGGTLALGVAVVTAISLKKRKNSDR